MRISYKWLQDYIDAPLPPAEDIAEKLTMHAFEVENTEHVEGDTLFEIAVLPNRSHDSLSYIGIAREVALLFDLPLKLPEFSYKGEVEVSTAESLILVPPDPKLVRRAIKRLVLDVKVGESPAWLKERLVAAGQRPINNIVDATNFVMLETGQPVHAFDYDKISGEKAKELFIRPAAADETITTLDGKEYLLDEGMLVIADQGKALDIAGVKGGANSGIAPGTTRVLLSACTFHPVSIRKTSRKLNLLTDASKRFEQDLSPVMAEQGMNRLAALVAEIAGGKVAQDVLDWYPKDLARTAAPYKIGTSLNEINQVLGTHLSENEVENILDRLVKHAGLSYEKVRPLQKVVEYAQTLVGSPYKWGASITFDAPRCFDCSSFVNHVFVQAGIPLPRMTFDQYVAGEEVRREDLQPGDLVFSLNTEGEGVKDALYVERLGTETATGSHHRESEDFMPGTKLSQILDHNGIYLGGGKIIHTARRMGTGVTVEDLDTSLFFKNVVGHRRVITNTEDRFVVTVPYERLDLRAGPGFMISGTSADLIEEIGRIYGYENITPQAPSLVSEPKVNKTFYYTNKIRDILVNEGFSEVMTYAFQSEGEVAVENPLAEDKKYLRVSLKEGLRGALEFNSRNKPLLGTSVVKIFEIGTVFDAKSERTELGVFAEYDSAKAAFAAIEKAFQKKMTPVFEGNGGTVDLTAFVKDLSEPGTLEDLHRLDVKDVRFTPLSSYPFTLRDIAVWVPDNMRSDLIEVIRKEAGPLLVRADQFDSFSKDGKTSYAYHLVFQSLERTLTDEEVNTIMERVTQVLNSKEGWKVR